MHPLVIFISLLAAIAAARVEIAGKITTPCPAHSAKFSPGNTTGFAVSQYDVISFVIDGDGNSVTFYGVDVAAGTIARWTSTIPLDTVYMKGGYAGAIAYNYIPEATSDPAQIHTAPNPNGKYAAIGYVMICYDYDVSVIVNYGTIAEYDLVSTWSTAIGTAPCVSGSVSQPVSVALPILVSHTDAVENVHVSGSFVVYNPDFNFYAAVASATASIGSFSMSVACGSFVIPPRGQTHCTFSGVAASGASRPIGNLDVVVAMLPTSKVMGGSSSSGIYWNEVDVGTTFVVRAISADPLIPMVVHTYTTAAPPGPMNVDVTPSATGLNSFEFTIYDANSDSPVGTATVCVAVSTSPGCVETINYWMTHAYSWIDRTYAFPTSTPTSWATILQTNPTTTTRVLARLWIAIKLSMQYKGADVSSIGNILQQLESYLATTDLSSSVAPIDYSLWIGKLSAYSYGFLYGSSVPMCNPVAVDCLSDWMINANLWTDQPYFTTNLVWSEILFSTYDQTKFGFYGQLWISLKLNIMFHVPEPDPILITAMSTVESIIRDQDPDAYVAAGQLETVKQASTVMLTFIGQDTPGCPAPQP